MPRSPQAEVSGRRSAFGRWWWGLAATAALVIAWGSLMPASELPEDLPWDKANHLIAYAGLATLLALASGRSGLSMGLAVAYGVAIEFAQIPVPGRLGGDVWDIVANILGAVLGVGAVWLWCRWRQRARR
ncbi:VanZ family protein [Halomonas sp. H33-56]|uniref:VanZ family protein n=1 Tax=Halomonas sp. RT37 TaxID=2950872 RepID=A0AAU7KK30_9GAMM